MAGTASSVLAGVTTWNRRQKPGFSEKRDASDPCCLTSVETKTGHQILTGRRPRKRDALVFDRRKRRQKHQRPPARKVAPSLPTASGSTRWADVTPDYIYLRTSVNSPICAAPANTPQPKTLLCGRRTVGVASLEHRHHASYDTVGFADTARTTDKHRLVAPCLAIHTFEEFPDPTRRHSSHRSYRRLRLKGHPYLSLVDT